MFKKSSILFVFIFAFTLALAACSPQPTANDLSGTSWHLVSYGPINQQIPAEEGVTTLVQFSADGQVSGSFGCNQFSGQYRVKGNSITFEKIISTLMACQEPQMSQESTGYQIFTGTARFELDGNSLIIQDAAGDNALHLTKLLMQ